MGRPYRSLRNSDHPVRGATAFRLLAVRARTREKRRETLCLKRKP